LGIGDWGLGPIPNPQSPIPNPQSPIPILFLFKLYKVNIFYFSKNKIKLIIVKIIKNILFTN
jgi:hypothetical protein